MCLAVPGKIIELINQSDDPLLGRNARVDMQGSVIEASLAMTPDAQPGTWVLVHAGFALSILDEAEAIETWEMLKSAMDDDPTAIVSDQ